MDQDKNFITLASTVKSFIDHLLEDPHRPGYHFAEPEGLGHPGDPNGAFYADGRYHLMYLYRHQDLGHCWGHISSIDLVHWRRHKDCLVAGQNARGCFSGGAFVDDDGTAYITLWDYIDTDDDFGSLRIAVSKPPYEDWKIQPDRIVNCDDSKGVASVIAEGGKCIPVSAADPSNIWKKDGVYYMQAGNLLVLRKYGSNEESPSELRGDWTDLYCSKDLIQWKYLHRFYQRDTSNKWTDETEDDMCPSFFPLPAAKDGGPLSGKYLQLFISHNKGCQYYIGDYDKAKDTFIPQTHGRMSWVDSAYFAPEALVDKKGRQIMWAWYRDDPKDVDKDGWCGVFSLPRVLWLNMEDNTLRMAPVPELECLRFNKKIFNPASLSNQTLIDNINGLSCEIELKAKVGAGGKIGFRTLASPGKDEYADILYDSNSGELQIDTRKCAKRGWPALEAAPFRLEENELLTMRVFVDKSVLEVFVNERQAAGRRAYPEQGGKGLSILKEGMVEILSLTVWEIQPSNPY
jgi:beta-fructofuranosidase